MPEPGQPGGVRPEVAAGRMYGAMIKCGVRILNRKRK
jgi:hypothetical protein